MFISNVTGTEAVQALATQLDCKVGEALKGRSGYGKPGIMGNTFGFKDQLKAAGARWDGDNKAWTFESWAALETALLAVIAAA